MRREGTLELCIYVTVSVSVRVCSEGMYFSKHAVNHTHTQAHTSVPFLLTSIESGH